MKEETSHARVYSMVSQTKGTPPKFFYEIWQALGNGTRWNVEVSREFSTVREAQKACDAKARWYIAERVRSP